MSIGQYRHLVTLTGPSGPAVFNGESWVTPYGPLTPPTWYCSIKRASVQEAERFAAGTTVTSRSHLLEGHYHAGITERTQITKDDGRVFYVSDVNNVEERNSTLMLLCDESVP